MSNEIIYAQNMDNDWVHTSDEDDYAEDDEETVTMTLEDDQFEEVSKTRKIINCGTIFSTLSIIVG